MYQSMLSGAYHGMESYLVHVEVDVSDGLPCMEMIGYLASQVKESKERVRVGIKNSGYKMPARRITISLTPADIRKDGGGFDLAVALGILLASEGRTEKVENVLFLGELGLDGSVKTVRGVLPILLDAKQRGVRYCVIPKENLAEALNVRGMKCFVCFSIYCLFICVFCAVKIPLLPPYKYQCLTVNVVSKRTKGKTGRLSPSFSMFYLFDFICFFTL